MFTVSTFVERKFVQLAVTGKKVSHFDLWEEAPQCCTSNQLDLVFTW